MNIVWIGMAVPESLAEKLSASDKYITSQTQTFQKRLIHALELEARNKVCIVSSPPITDWSRLRFTGLVRWRHSRSEVPNLVVPIINFIGIKQLCVGLGCFLGACFGALRMDRHRTLLVVGDSYFPHLFAAWLASLVTGLRCVAIVTDLPGLLAVADPWYKRLLRPIDTFLVYAMIRRMRGLVALSHHIAKDYFPEMRQMVLHGIAESPPPLTGAEYQYRRDDEFIVMYTGALMEEYGVGILVEAFRLLPGRNLQLWITGKGDYEAQVRTASTQDTRIKFLGYIGREELRTRLQQADVLVSLRISHSGHARYSFPSKVLEYMCHGKFVITNQFPSLPASYAQHLIILGEETASSLASLLQNIADGQHGDGREFAGKMRAFIQAEASAEVQGRRLSDFLHQVTGPA